MNSLPGGRGVPKVFRTKSVTHLVQADLLAYELSRGWFTAWHGICKLVSRNTD